ncbi:MAG TPA: transcriptional regulator [Candidatus Angelobacter sp.]|nr:transcriptional regulator [Candidatus Angelobacter sp.]
MPREGQSGDVIRFNAYEVNLRAGELFRGGRKIPLQVQPFHVLAMLLERPGEVVARDELRKRLWPADTFVDFDHSLNTAIKKLRQALSDDKKKPRYIETLPKRGYRFIGTVEQRAGAAVRAPGKSGGESPWVGRIARVCVDGKTSFALVSVDEEAAAEREKLDAANDDVGLSLLIAAQKLFLVANGTPVRILAMQEQISRCQVRILEGEHYGKSALIPLKWLAALEKE